MTDVLSADKWHRRMRNDVRQPTCIAPPTADTNYAAFNDLIKKESY